MADRLLELAAQHLMLGEHVMMVGEVSQRDHASFRLVTEEARLRLVLAAEEEG